jgi:predicted metal-binding membrane protein
MMLVLFVGGVMSLTIIAILTLAVAVEKLAPRGVLLAKLGSLPLIAWGLWLIASALFAAPALS